MQLTGIIFSNMYDGTSAGYYCESILFRGAEISSFEDDGHIRGYLTSWIALPTKLKNTKLLPSIFYRCETKA